MSELNRDIIYLILKELKDDKKSFHTCILVNKTWCEMIIPILWKDPWKYLKEGNEILLLNVIISHLSDESKEKLTQHYKVLLYHKPLFDYIKFCKHLNLIEIERIINLRFPIIENEIINLFINENTKFTHLYIGAYQYNYQIHLIPGAKQCFSELQFLSCNTRMNDDILIGLTDICKSIKELELSIEVDNNNYGIIKLIEAQKKLCNIRFLTKPFSKNESSFCEILEKSLIKHENNIEYFMMTRQPITRILSYFTNLKYLELVDNSCPTTWNCLENLSFPHLQILKGRRVPINILTNLIEKTSGYLIEIKIDHIPHNEINNKRIFQAIYQNCPKLKYLKLLLKNNNILELEKLLNNCQYLNGLYIIFEDVWDGGVVIDWVHFFKILTKSSPIKLYKFKFHYNNAPDLDTLKLFFEDWKDRHPMLLQTIQYYNTYKNESYDLIEKYKAKGIVKKYDDALSEFAFEDFEWLNKDVLYLIFEELKVDKRTLHSCLLINKSWCEIIVPILWKDPWKYCWTRNGKLLLNVIISHLSEQQRDNLGQHFNFLTKSYKKPLFNYVSFCKHLNFNEIKRIINNIDEKSEISIIENEIINLFIKENTRFTHLYIPCQFNYQIHLIPGAKWCFSELQFLNCNTSINDTVLTGLMEICKSIKELSLSIEKDSNNYKIFKLIETQKKLLNVHVLANHQRFDEPFCKALENSLIKHANFIQYFKTNKQPITKFLSSFVNLKRLELDDNFHYMIWNYLENLSLPFLQILKAKGVPIKVLASLIENTGGYLTEINIEMVCHDEINNKRIIQAIYQNCLNLKYLKLLFKNNNIVELEKLLIKCQYLDGLCIIFEDNWDYNIIVDWDYFFKVLIKSSPTNLYKFKFIYKWTPGLDTIKSFLDGWKGRHPMLLQTQYLENLYLNLMAKYKVEGIVKKYDYMRNFDDFEWILRKSDYNSFFTDYIR
ncbi:hypothetical protein C1645_877231 [Glomus cerebriforme]|uniref:F-box domain-containing protein n=1 Tax=Glomus cerebriforme TaxID=658196 RepID=A0A397SXV7_9GLOM|nr:hypothetical protein C1645_877231 [Glomus cerebriforme]